MKPINWKKAVFVLTLAAIIIHIGLAYKGIIENYEAFTCILGYIAIGVLITTMLPEIEMEKESKPWWQDSFSYDAETVMDQVIEKNFGYKKEKTLEETI